MLCKETCSLITAVSLQDSASLPAWFHQLFLQSLLCTHWLKEQSHWVYAAKKIFRGRLTIPSWIAADNASLKHCSKWDTFQGAACKSTKRSMERLQFKFLAEALLREFLPLWCWRDKKWLSHSTSCQLTCSYHLMGLVSAVIWSLCGSQIGNIRLVLSWCSSLWLVPWPF